MYRNEYDDTICAIASGHDDKSAIAIVRVSGHEAISIVSKHFERPLKNRRALLGRFSDNFAKQIDQVIALLMKGPNSYTGDDLVEVHCHGGLVQPKRVLEVLCNSGCRLAKPGEFTKRALLNGKIDLLQAEAVKEVIESKTTFAAKLAMENVSGRSSRAFKQLRDNLVSVISNVEFNLDFPEDDQLVSNRELLVSLKTFHSLLSSMANTFKSRKILLKGPLVAIVGNVNVGKSSIFNAILKEERAIVTKYSGTTRDSLSENVELAGYSFRLMDTAGIRNSVCPIEKIGIARTREISEEADLRIFVRDIRYDLDCEMHNLDHCNEKDIFIANKQDLVKDYNEFLKGNETAVSALTGMGMDKLIACIAARVEELNISSFREQEAVIHNQRQFDSVSKALEALSRAIALMKDGLLDLVALELRDASQSLELLLGEISNEDVLNEVFSKFCLGK